MKDEEYLEEISKLRKENRELTYLLHNSTKENECHKKEIAQRQETNYSLGFFIGIAVAYLYLKCFTNLDIFYNLSFWGILGKLLIETAKAILVSFVCLVVGTLVKISIDGFESPYSITIKKKALAIAILFVCALSIAAIIIFFKVS